MSGVIASTCDGASGAGLGDGSRKDDQGIRSLGLPKRRIAVYSIGASDGTDGVGEAPHGPVRTRFGRPWLTTCRLLCGSCSLDCRQCRLVSFVSCAETRPLADTAADLQGLGVKATRPQHLQAKR